MLHEPLSFVADVRNLKENFAEYLGLDPDNAILHELLDACIWMLDTQHYRLQESRMRHFLAQLRPDAVAVSTLPVETAIADLYRMTNNYFFQFDLSYRPPLECNRTISLLEDSDTAVVCYYSSGESA